MSNILIIGRHGMLARALRYVAVNRKHRVRALGRADFDARIWPTGLDLDGIDAVVNTAGLTNRRLASGASSEDAYLVNALFPRLLADLCEDRNVPLVHISTDCVFSGQTGGYLETDRPDATDLYGRSKACGEPRNCLVLRTSIVGPETTNGDSLLCWFLSQVGKCTGYGNHFWSGVTTLELSRVIVELVERRLIFHGMRHVFGVSTTKRRILEAFREAFAHPIEILPGASNEPRNMILSTLYPDFIASFAIRPFVEQLAEIQPIMDARGYWRANVPG